MESKSNQIITVGFSPAWDITNYVNGIDWGQHKVISSQTIAPAGKPLNISKALAKMSKASTAAGLWGTSDYQQLLDYLSDAAVFIDFKFTVVEGRTRQNITVVDTLESKDIHLRASSEITAADNIIRLKNDLDEIIKADSTVIFAGSMPHGKDFDACLSVIKEAIAKGADVIVDTSSDALLKIVEIGNIFMIKPNEEELSQLLGKSISDDIASIVADARTLCDKVKIVLVSLGANGAVLVTADNALHCKVKPSNHKVVNTVSCGDYLLAGFVSEGNSDLCKRLQTAVKLATARAWGLTENKRWPTISKEIDMEINLL